MAGFVTLATNISLAGTGTSTAVSLRDTPINPYRNCQVSVNLDGVTGTPTILIEGSENGGTSYSTLATVAITAGLPCVLTEIKAYPLVRVNRSVAGSAGIANVYMEPI